ncbi:PREDICTED: arylacetamide deacetylase-like 4 [Chaetura pelagica]|uniref:arylacetamide deacetylase-like 4 n=1 Tax=Chaetura pelagica TaxID=8897 RepID=UPI0005232E23|nr:PREDICTED: arylacetamide deacetylase-like 4 [Chaetura pelagica]
MEESPGEQQVGASSPPPRHAGAHLLGSSSGKLPGQMAADASAPAGDEHVLPGQVAELGGQHHAHGSFHHQIHHLHGEKQQSAQPLPNHPLVPGGILVAFVLLVLIAIYHDSFKVEILPGIDQPAKIRLYNWLYVSLDILAKNLDSLGVIKEHILLRLVTNGLPACRDSRLFIQDLHFDEVPVRVYLPKGPSASKRRGVIFFHGGCGLFGSIGSYERPCRYIARKSDSVVVSVGYRLSPEHKYPAQFLDCLAATLHFLKTAENYGVDPDRIIVCGDSAGGTYAARVCQELVNRRDIPKIRAQVLIYPFLQSLNFNLPSNQKNAFVAFLSRDRGMRFLLKYLQKDPSIKAAVLAGSHVPESMNLKYRKWINPDLIPEELRLGYKPPLPAPFLPQVHEETKEMFQIRFSPLLAEDAVVSCLPGTCIITCEHDVIRDDGLLYKKRLEDNNVPVTWHHLHKGFHGVLSIFGYGIFSFPSASELVNHTVNFIKGY